MTTGSVTYPPRLSLAHLPTPLQPLDRLSARLGGPRIWVKRDDLTGCATSGNKIRKLEFSLAEAKVQGCDTLITCGGQQSNHCRTTAVLAAQLGLQVHLILRGNAPSSTPDGNLFLDQLVGARISHYTPSDYQQNLAEYMQQWQTHYEDEGKKPFLIPTGASDEIGIWGYIACSEELQKNFRESGITPKHIICATGSGGTQAGLTAGNTIFNLGAKVWGINVCDDEAYFVKKVAHDLSAWKDRYKQALDIDRLVTRVIDGYVGAGYAKASPDVFKTIKLLAGLEGLLLDPVYTGKAFHGMLEELRQGRFDDAKDIVFIHTGGLFGLFSQRDQLEQLLS